MHFREKIKKNLKQCKRNSSKLFTKKEHYKKVVEEHFSENNMNKFWEGLKMMFEWGYSDFKKKTFNRKNW